MNQWGTNEPLAALWANATRDRQSKSLFASRNSDLHRPRPDQSTWLTRTLSGLHDGGDPWLAKGGGKASSKSASHPVVSDLTSLAGGLVCMHLCSKDSCMIGGQAPEAPKHAHIFRRAVLYCAFYQEWNAVMPARSQRWLCV